MMWDSFKKMFWKYGCKKTVERELAENRSRQMPENTVKRINDNLERFANAESLEERQAVLKEWQKEIMEKNGTDEKEQS